jgi:hypothetical protein
MCRATSGQHVRPPDWPYLELSSLGDARRASAEMEILNICDAKLFRRTATLIQKGMIVTFGDAKYAFNRKGTLGWSAIDAQCPGPEGHVRFQAEPFYHYQTTANSNALADWESSYIRLPQRNRWTPTQIPPAFLGKHGPF